LKKIVAGIIIICLYCFPFVYFSMHQDFANGSMLGYLIMIVVTSTLAYFGKLANNLLSIIIGNLLSLFISYYLIGGMTENERWGGYFKPLSPNQLLILVSIFNLIPQFFAIKSAVRNKNRV